MALKLYLLRHGETEYSRTGSYCGATDAALTAAGEQMAVAFAATYQTLNWRAIYASPMKRAIATAKPLCDATSIAPLLRDGLKEIFYGEWEDQTPDYVQQHYAEAYLRWLTEPAWNAPTGGETSVQIASRALPVIAEIEQNHPDGNVLIVSHKATIRIILCSLLGIDLGRYRDRINTLTGSVSLVSFEKYGPRLDILGDRSYMPAELRDRPGT